MRSHGASAAALSSPDSAVGFGVHGRFRGAAISWTSVARPAALVPAVAAGDRLCSCRWDASRAVSARNRCRARRAASPVPETSSVRIPLRTGSARSAVTCSSATVSIRTAGSGCSRGVAAVVPGVAVSWPAACRSGRVSPSSSTVRTPDTASSSSVSRSSRPPAGQRIEVGTCLPSSSVATAPPRWIAATAGASSPLWMSAVRSGSAYGRANTVASASAVRRSASHRLAAWSAGMRRPPSAVFTVYRPAETACTSSSTAGSTNQVACFPAAVPATLSRPARRPEVIDARSSSSMNVASSARCGRSVSGSATARPIRGISASSGA